MKRPDIGVLRRLGALLDTVDYSDTDKILLARMQLKIYLKQQAVYRAEKRARRETFNPNPGA